MIFKTGKAFEKQLDKLKSKDLDRAVLKIYDQVGAANSLSDIPNIKKLKGFQTCYRIRYKDYRIGFAYQDNTLFFMAIAHRKNIYNIFP
ncbi:MAG: type II toxin-antitoxin system RelE/ParE family toxin [Bacteroidetes bacterium]|nr:type II toxin-antitoxin system RelE/ParE family toxin [Bacteroidota bacterium]